VNTPGLADGRVRQAFGYALNRPRVVERALFGFGRPTSIPWPEQSLAYDSTLDQTYSYDPDHARQLLADAGWDATTVVPLAVANGMQVAVQMAEIIQADLANVGVHVALQTLSAPEFLGRLQEGQMGGAWIVNMGLRESQPRHVVYDRVRGARAEPVQGARLQLRTRSRRHSARSTISS